MNKGAFDTFAFVITLSTLDKERKHVIVVLFEAQGSNGSFV
jgi:hypothetical protein